MLSPRAPLFSVSLAFAIGCLLGLDEGITLRLALGFGADEINAVKQGSSG